MRMRGTVRLCDEGGCGFRWRECPTHTPIIAYGIASGLAEHFEKRGTCRECGYQLHAPKCSKVAKDLQRIREDRLERGKPNLPQRADPFADGQYWHRQCPTCGYTADGLSGIADCKTYKELCKLHASHRAGWLAEKQQPAAPAVRAGWHAGLDGRQDWFQREDRRAGIWNHGDGYRAGGPCGQLARGDVFYGHAPSVEACPALTHATADEAMQYADARLAEEDARKQEDRSEPPSGWVVAKASIVGDWWHWHRLSGCDGICCFAAGNDPAGHDRRLGRAEAVAACWAAVDAEKAR